jgi:hypothetical protein
MLHWLAFIKVLSILSLSNCDLAGHLGRAKEHGLTVWRNKGRILAEVVCHIQLTVGRENTANAKPRAAVTAQETRLYNNCLKLKAT